MDRVEYQSMVIQDIINLEEKGELNTTPWYQRRSVWNPGQKSYLINTIFEKKPILHFTSDTLLTWIKE